MNFLLIIIFNCHAVSLEQALSFNGEKIVYIGIGTYSDKARTDLGENVDTKLAYAQSFPAFMKDFIENKTFEEKCKIILIDPLWFEYQSHGGYQNSALSCYLKDTPSYMYIVEDGLSDTDFVKIEKYLETIFKNGGVAIVANFGATTEEINNVYNRLRSAYIRKIQLLNHIYAYAVINGVISRSCSAVWWDNHNYISSDHNDLRKIETKLSTPISRLVDNISNVRMWSKRVQESKRASDKHDYDFCLKQLNFIEKRCTLKKESIVAPLTCTIVSLLKADNLPLLTYNIVQEGSEYFLAENLLVFPQFDAWSYVTPINNMFLNLITTEKAVIDAIPWGTGESDNLLQSALATLKQSLLNLQQILMSVSARSQ